MAHIEWLHGIFLHYPMLKYLTVFLGTALGGEIFLIAFAFLAAQGFLSLYALVPLTFLGTFSADATWFLLGRTKVIGELLEHKYATPAVRVITAAIQKLSRGSHFLALVFAKFLFGTRIITILYVSKTHLSVKKFLHFNSYAVLFWLMVVIPIGYSSGLGFAYVATVFKNVYAAIGFALLVLLMVILLQLWIKNRFTSERDANNL